MSQENVELVMSLQSSGEEDFTQLIRDDGRHRRKVPQARPEPHLLPHSDAEAAQAVAAVLADKPLTNAAA